VGVEAGNQFEVGDKYDELKVVGMTFKKSGTHWNPDLHNVILLSTGLLFRVGKCVFKLASVTELRNYRKSFIYQVETLFLAINIFQKSNHPFPGVIFKHGLQ
jgi:hypothetical protein